MYLELLTNVKKQKKHIGQLIPQIESIIHKNQIQIDCNNSLEELVDSFILSYMKLVKKIETDDESHTVAESLIEEILKKVEATNALIPIMEKKIVQISNYCEENKKKPKTIVKMGN